MIENAASSSWSSTQCCAPGVHAEPHTHHAIPLSRHTVARPMTSNPPTLNQAVDTCVVDTQLHLNEPCQSDWPVFRELERRCRLGWWGPCWRKCHKRRTGLPGSLAPLVPTDSGPHSEMVIAWLRKSQPACARKGWVEGTSATEP